MQITTVTQKGQITLPKPMRDKLGLTPYKKVELRAGKGYIKVTPAISIFDIAGKFTPRKNKSVDPVKARGYMEKNYKVR